MVTVVDASKLRTQVVNTLLCLDVRDLPHDTSLILTLALCRHRSWE